jgi:hypothetical protein
MAKKSAGQGSKAGLGLAALAAAGAAAAAGYYFYASENAPKHRKIAAKWAGDMKRDVIKEAKKLQKIDKAAIMKIVNQAQAAYAKNGPKIDKAALVKAASELKKHWDEIRDEITPAKPAAKKTAKKTAKKSAKKTA